MERVRPARTKDDADAIYGLAYEFVGWLRQRDPEMESEIETYLHGQRFDEQIREVLIHYNPPKGECLLAFDGAIPVGILMLKDLGGGVCEMNRMFVRESARGLGLGGALRGVTESMLHSERGVITGKRWLETDTPMPLAIQATEVANSIADRGFLGASDSPTDAFSLAPPSSSQIRM